MPVPSSGQLRLYADIGVELGVDQSNVSLGTMSDSAGFSEPDTMSDFYGYVDAIAPSVTTNSSTSVTSSSMVLNGNVTSDGGATVTSRGFYFGTSSNYASNTKYTVGSGTGAFSTTRSGLASNTRYYFTAFAINSVGETVGSTLSQLTSYNYVFNSVYFHQDTSYGNWETNVGAYYENISGSWVGIYTNIPDGYHCIGFADNRPNILYGYNLTANWKYAQGDVYVNTTICGGARSVNNASITRSNAYTGFGQVGSIYRFQANGGGGTSGWAKWSWN